MAKKMRVGAVTLAMLVGVSPAALAAPHRQVTEQGVTVLRGNPITSNGVEIGVGGGVAPAIPGNTGNAANAPAQSGNLNAVFTGSSNAGGEILNPPPGAGR